ncbi:hypothetical protein SDC9_199215 [bioreactor metagenome]|uniref:Uncharacterized protein n=1 Tax=bioreactor metagenome TaxID=1076179 RepID=A0A645IJW4_9ZZZZ
MCENMVAKTFDDDLLIPVQQSINGFRIIPVGGQANHHLAQFGISSNRGIILPVNDIHNGVFHSGFTNIRKIVIA